MRPFSLTMQSQRLDVQRLGLALLAGATMMGLAWTGFAVASRARPSDPPGQCVDMDEPRGRDGVPPAAEGPDPRCPADDLPHPPVMREGQVVIGKKELTVTVEIAELPWELKRGLMYRTQMAEDRGMLLTYPRRGDTTMRMHNTCIPLDILFVDEDGTIVGIEENARPMDERAIRARCSSRHVIALNAGFCRRHGVRPGHKARVVGN
jgi:uncharacterized membrane protein (UPF0127 family)